VDKKKRPAVNASGYVNLNCLKGFTGFFGIIVGHH